VVHDGMQYDPIHGQCQGHELFRVGNLAVSKAISSAIYKGADREAKLLLTAIHCLLTYFTYSCLPVQCQTVCITHHHHI